LVSRKLPVESSVNSDGSLVGIVYGENYRGI
jgi:hypothetical protein